MRGDVAVALATALAFGAQGCDSPIEEILEPPPRVLVHAVLDLAADTQKVLLEWTRSSTTEVGILGATVTVTTPTGRTIPLAFRSISNPGGPAVYFFRASQDPEGLVAGGTYALRIDGPDGETITGTTTIPNAIVAPMDSTPSFDRSSDTLRLAWPRAPGAHGYRVIVTNGLDGLPGFPEGPFVPGFIPVYTLALMADTSVELAGTRQSLDGLDDFFFAGMHVIVNVVAGDENYASFYRASIDPFAGAPPSRLTGGAVGLFGSVVPIVRRRFDVISR